MVNVISVDVEDYFHPTEVRAWVGTEGWESLPSRVEENGRRTLDLMARHQVRGTFFVLGWVARRYPKLVRSIAEAGHEIACHSYGHDLVYRMSPEAFRADTIQAMTAIGDACGVVPRAYRAPSFSITSDSLWALEILVELGFTHDSSIYPIPHDRYGIPGSTRHPHQLQTPSGPIIEVPLASARLGDGRVTPVGGGAYLRLLPYRYTAAGIRRINDRERQPACIYFHPWELDPDQPRLARGAIARFRTYSGLGRMQAKLERLFGEFSFSTLASVFPAG